MQLGGGSLANARAALGGGGAAAGAVRQRAQKARPSVACAKTDFEAVVNEAGAALRDLNQQNTPLFPGQAAPAQGQAQLEQRPVPEGGGALRARRGIVGYDQKSEELLTRITGGGQVGGGPAPDCTLSGLGGALKVLVETQKAKWTYMFAKLDKELAK